MISAVVLAAGLSTRMGGRTKALLPIDDRDTFVTRIVRTFHEAGISDVAVIVGHEAALVESVVAASGLRAQVVLNEAYQQGQITSVIAGIDAVERSGADAMLLALVDAPLFSASTVQALAQRFSETGAPVVRAVRGLEHGHPVLIARALFDDIRRADPVHGAKPIVRAHASQEGDVPVDDDGAFVDVDTPDDYERLRDQQRRFAVTERTVPAAPSRPPERRT